MQRRSWVRASARRLVAVDAHKRGRQFEVLVTDLFLLFDMEPRLSYSTATERLVGSVEVVSTAR
jgi:hypothetical protein